MNFETIGNVVRNLVKSWVAKRLTVENVGGILNALVAMAREKSDATEAVWDDWVVDFFESVVADEKKVGVLVEFVKLGVDRVCMDVQPAADGPEYDPYNALAQKLEAGEEGVCEFSFDKIILIANLLREIVPILIEFFREK